jgi:hypothetical protein
MLQLAASAIQPIDILPPIDPSTKLQDQHHRKAAYHSHGTTDYYGEKELLLSFIKTTIIDSFRFLFLFPIRLNALHRRCVVI